MTVHSFITQEQLLAYVASHGQLELASDYYVQVDNVQGFETLLPLLSFTVPTGVVFNPGEPFSHLSPSISSSSISLTFFRQQGTHSFEFLYSNQLTADGALRFIPVKSRPTLRIYRKVGPEYLLFELVGCQFSKPIPNPSLSSTDHAVYTMTVTFEDFNS